MSKKGINIFEEHVEKIVLAIVGLICLWLLITHVVISPSVVSYDNKKFSSGKIDVYISEQSRILTNKLNRKAESKEAYNPQFDKFNAMVDSAISNIDSSITLLQPNKVTEIASKRKYHIPLVGQISDIEVEHLRAVAYVPTEEISEKKFYSAAEHAPEDIDFVTVEARFDVSQVYENFYESFGSKDSQEQRRESFPVEPIFAAVQLQRQELLDDDSWSDWQIISRIKIDHRKKMFTAIEDVKELPAGGVKVRLLQFNNMEVQMDLLQPLAYVIASAREEWFPPSLHKEYVKQQKELRAQQRRKAITLQKEEREREQEEARAQRSRASASRRSKMSSSAGDDYGSYESDYSSGIAASIATRKQSRSADDDLRREKGRSGLERSKDDLESTKNIYTELAEIWITNNTDFVKMRQPLVFWAHDDAVEPAKTYRYRMRLGVFNPIAGTERISKRDKQFENKVILWSDFSDVTQSLTIPGTLYFFPREIQQAAKTVSVQVSRYALGYWYSENFTVRHGEVIGRVLKNELVEPSEEDEEEKKPKIVMPGEIDYSTGAVLVDVVPVDDWSGIKALHARHYFDMLYSFDGTNISRMPVKQRYWREELRGKFNEIKRLEKEPKEPLRSWTASSGTRTFGAAGMGYDEYDDLSGF